MTPELRDQLIVLAIQQAPAMIAGLKALFRDRHPEVPEPTDVEVIAAFNQAFFLSLAVDEKWLAEHPKQ